MPRRATSESASNSSSVFSSAPPTDAAGEPLPVPTTLGSHIIGSRLLRSASRSTRTSRSSSTLTSRSSSHAPQADLDTAVPGQAGSLTSGLSGLLDRIGLPPPPSAPTGENPENPGTSHSGGVPVDHMVQAVYSRRRRYSIRDELDNGRDSSTSSSSLPSLTPTSEEYIPSDTSRSPPKRKRRTTATKNKGKAVKRRKLNNSAAIEVSNEAGPSSLPSTSTLVAETISPLLNEDEVPIYEVESSPASATATPPEPHTVTSEPLSEYTCPICFSPPTNATLTPCGHVCCGECLFTAVRATLQRGAAHNFREPNVPRCPVCRAVLNGWDGRGGGVIGLKPRTIISL